VYLTPNLSIKRWDDDTSGILLACCVESTGVKNLLAGEQQAAVTVAVEGLMDAKPSPDLDNFATFDPKVCAICSESQ
jgi:hypothetical protein